MSTATAALPLRQHLRAATTDVHEQLDQQFSQAFAVATPTSYGGFLGAIHAALGPLEELLEHSGVTTLLPDWPARCRRQALAADLAGLDATAQPLALGKTGLTQAEAWGVLYVLEGSRLGGQLLFRQAQAAPVAAVRENTRYLTPRADLWKSFLVHLEQAAPDAAQTINGARWAFALFLQAARHHSPASRPVIAQ